MHKYRDELKISKEGLNSKDLGICKGRLRCFDKNTSK